VIADDVLGAGSHTLSWNGGGVAAGVYFLRLATDTITETRRVERIR
jgi:hypothetical protein